MIKQKEMVGKKLYLCKISEREKIILKKQRLHKGLEN